MLLMRTLQKSIPLLSKKEFLHLLRRIIYCSILSQKTQFFTEDAVYIAVSYIQPLRLANLPLVSATNCKHRAVVGWCQCCSHDVTLFLHRKILKSFLSTIVSRNKIQQLSITDGCYTNHKNVPNSILTLNTQKCTHYSVHRT